MRYFTLTDILRAILCSSFLGFIMGGIYKSLSTLIFCIYRLLTVIFAVFKSRSILSLREQASIKPHSTGGGKNAYDFVFFIVFGVSYILLCYIALDGVHRLYVLLPAILTFFVSKCTLGSIFEKAVFGLYALAYFITFNLLFVFSYPLRIVIRYLQRLLSVPAKRVIGWGSAVTNKKLIKKKQRQIKAFFKSASLI